MILFDFLYKNLIRKISCRKRKGSAKKKGKAKKKKKKKQQTNLINRLKIKLKLFIKPDLAKNATLINALKKYINTLSIFY